MLRKSFLAIALSAMLPSLAFSQQFVNQTSTRFPTQSEYSSQVAIADVDGDGDLDIAFANGRGFFSASLQEPVRLYINNGSGVFSDDSANRLGISGYGRDVEFGDVDHDGDLDLVVANDFNTLPKLMLNDGNGFFTDVSAAQLPGISLGGSHASFGDVDNDGDLDLWFTNGGASRFGAGQAMLYLNDGMGFYSNATVTHLPQQLVSEPMNSIFGDLDGDFDLDMVEGHRAGNSKLYTNNGSGIFSDTTSGNLPADNNTYSYDLGDLDNDGDLDMVGANSSPTSSRETLFINDGTGTFSNQTSSLLPNSSNPNIDDNDSKFFDYDNDGDLDFIIASLSGSSGERICRNNGTGFTLQSGIITNSPDSTLDVELGDLDGNGTLDIVTAQGESGNFQNKVYMNNGPADTRPPTFPNVEQQLDTFDTAGPYVVRAVIRDSMTSDHNFFADRLALMYSVNNGLEMEVELVWSGGDVYRAEIPGQAGGSTVRYRFEASDHHANAGASVELEFDVMIQFKRGDVNIDGSLDISDPISLLGFLFPAASPPVLSCLDAADTNDDTAIDVADVIALLNSIFGGLASPLPAPYPDCGVDPTADALGCNGATCP